MVSGILFSNVDVNRGGVRSAQISASIEFNPDNPLYINSHCAVSKWHDIVAVWRSICQLPQSLYLFPREPSITSNGHKCLYYIRSLLANTYWVRSMSSRKEHTFYYRCMYYNLKFFFSIIPDHNIYWFLTICRSCVSNSKIPPWRSLYSEDYTV